MRRLSCCFVVDVVDDDDFVVAVVAVVAYVYCMGFFPNISPY